MKLLTISEAADYLGVSVSTVYNLRLMLVVPCSQTPVWEHISAKLRFARSYDVEFLPTWERELHHFRRSEAGASGIGVPKQELGHQEKRRDRHEAPHHL